MKGKLSFWVTLVCLVCCIVFTGLHAHATLDQLNRSATDDLLRICRMSSLYLDNAAFSAPAGVESAPDKAMIRELAAELKVSVSVLDKEGSVVVSTQTTALANAEIVNATELDAAFASSQGEGAALRGTNVYAACRLDNGGAIQIWREAPTLWTVLGHVSGRTLLIAAALIVLCCIMVQIIITPIEDLLMGVKRMMFDFSEGRFDGRLNLKDNGQYITYVNEVNEAARRIEDKLVSENRHMQAMSAVMNQSQNGMLAVNNEMKITVATATAKRLLGIRGSCLGKRLEEANKEIELEKVFEEAMQHDGVSTQDIEVRSRLMVGNATPVQLYISPLKHENKLTGAVAMVEDVTELRRMERIRNDFAANVSHELKTPLTSIKGFVETLMVGAIDNRPMAMKFLGIIMSEADRLTRLINDILSITKMESGQTEVSNERIQIDAMAAKTVEILKLNDNARNRNIKVTLNQPSEPLYVWGNPDRVEQLLMNLIENAIKYNKENGSVSVLLSVTNDKIHLEVSDTGIGIEEKHLDRLFERFYRVDKGRSRNMGGTGLGLAIVKHIAQSMGGMIEVHSKYGEGTTFLVDLPKYAGQVNQSKANETQEEV